MLNMFVVGFRKGESTCFLCLVVMEPMLVPMQYTMRFLICRYVFDIARSPPFTHVHRHRSHSPYIYMLCSAVKDRWEWLLLVSLKLSITIFYIWTKPLALTQQSKRLSAQLILLILRCCISQLHGSASAILCINAKFLILDIFHYRRIVPTMVLVLWN